MWDAAKAMLRRKCIALIAYIKEERSQINNLNSYLNTRKRKQTQSKTEGNDKDKIRNQ